MSARAGLVAILLMAACAAPKAPLYPAGSGSDDGYGDLAQKSARFMTSDEPEGSLFTPHAAARRGAAYGGDAYGGDPYGAGMYGGDAYGGASYAAYAPPSWGYPNPNRAPHYNQTAGLSGAIEGTVSWSGATPAHLASACGAIENPSVRVGSDKAIGGILVYIEHVEVGRTMPNYGRPASVGGTITKHGCSLEPAVQIVTPLPASLAIHGDAHKTKLRVTSPNGAKPFELQEAGRVVMQAQPGITRVEGEDGSLAAAWVVAADTPYYALTDDAGRYRIDELAAGTYDVTFWQPPLATIANGKIVYGSPVITHRSIKVDSVKAARLDVSLGR